MIKGRKKKATRAPVSKIADKKAIGDEPVYEAGANLTSLQQTLSYNWYNYFVSVSTGYKYLLSYMKERDISLHNKIKKYSEKDFPSTLFWIARLLSHGYVLQDSTMEYFKNRLNESLIEAKKKRDIKKSESPTKTLTIQDKIKAKVYDFIGETEENIDKRDIGDFYNKLVSYDMPQQSCSTILKFYTPIRDEIKEVYKGKKTKENQDLFEGYQNCSKKELSVLFEMYNTIVEDTIKYEQNKKNVRKKPRVKKTVSLEKKIKNFKFQKDNSEYKVVSVNPTGIIGASEVWTFNTKYKEVRVFKTSSSSGLDIKGTSLINVDEETSISQKCGNKSEKIIQDIMSSNKSGLKKVLKILNTKTSIPSPRINNDMLILRII